MWKRNKLNLPADPLGACLDRLPKLAVTQLLTARGLGILCGALVLAGVLGATTPESSAPAVYVGTIERQPLRAVQLALDTTHLEAAQQALDRARTLIDYSIRFNIDAELAAKIYDVALEQRIDPEVGFRLVYVESRFDPEAKSWAGAIGLTQLLPNTARWFDPQIREDDLYDADVNLRLGFRYLRELLAQFEGDLPLALTAYNRGPARLRRLLAGGVEPWNGYASSVLDGYESQ